MQRRARIVSQVLIYLMAAIQTVQCARKRVASSIALHPLLNAYFLYRQQGLLPSGVARHHGMWVARPCPPTQTCADSLGQKKLYRKKSSIAKEKY